MKKSILKIILSVLFSLILFGCSKIGTVQGIVKDEYGNIVENATVKISPSVSDSLVTNSKGEFEFVDLQAGVYQITVSKDGFFSSTKDVTVEKGQIVNVDFILNYDVFVTIPAISTEDATDITSTSVKISGFITDLGNATVTGYGHCWSTLPEPTIDDEKTDFSFSAELDTFTSYLSNLDPVTTYYSRAYATNSEGTSYSTEISFTTNAPEDFPAVTTNLVSNVSSSSAICSAEVTTDGGCSIISMGFCCSTIPNDLFNATYFSASNTGVGNYSVTISGLSSNTTYYIKAYVQNCIGYSYGSEISITTLP
ncbi:MAG: carboxypeptidase regulatory-like domain-containing protein [Bacteroidales bacterium]|nr:carboxypeptidase regulatory-like domain-containing protein [Bacteroidales bacterium]